MTDYGKLDEADHASVCEMLAWSFGFPAPDAEPWLHRAGLENVRVQRDGDRAAACALLIPMGQFFGGRRVPMVGLAGVATAPDKRGSGVASEMLNAMLAELHDDGIALSTLYPATRSLYRKSGWEPAGGHFKAKAPVASMRLRERDLELRPMTDADREEIISVYRQQAARTSGNLDRGDFQWGRVHRPRGAADVRGFVTGRRGSIEGYVILHEKRVDRGFLDYDLMVTDLVALTPEAGRRLITFFGDHATLGGNVIWGTGPNDPIVQLLPERGYELHLADHWMLRVVDVQAALAERGYPEHLEIELHLEVRDDILAANDGRFILRVAGGRAEVKRGGRGRIQMHVRGLAALYSGHLTPHALESAGLLQATEPELAKAAAVFAGPFPWMPDYF